MMAQIRSAIRDLGVDWAGRAGVHLTSRTPVASVKSLMRRLHPRQGTQRLVRLGPETDGGYLLPDDFEGIAYAYSPGVAKESRFEEDLAKRGITVFLADASVDGPTRSHELFRFAKKFVGSLEEGETTTLDQWKLDTIGHYAGDLMLQMDIEGSEYETLLATSAGLLRQFRILIIEFHHLQELWNRRFFDLASRAFCKLLATHQVVHLHPNNWGGSVRQAGIEIPRLLEVTLLRRDRLSTETFSRRFPHPLDRDNTSRPPLVLPRCWYR